MVVDPASIRLLAFGVDGVLTDGTTWWGGEARGWLQRYCVRDGEALRRLGEDRTVLPLSRNRTASASEHMAALDMDARWLGVGDKVGALRRIQREYVVEPSAIAFVGDGPEDAAVFGAVGLGLAVADAHPEALAAAHVVLQARGGARVLEEIELRLAGRWTPP